MTFSITIPAYKSQYLDEAIRSVVSQTYTDWELIIVDDCSPEDLQSIATPYLADNRIRFFRNERNTGAINVVDNWNTCLSYCTGDYVICMGDDDRLLPGCLEEYGMLMARYPGLNVYHAWTQIIDEQGCIIHLQEPRPEWESALSMLWNRWDHRQRQYIGDFCYSVAHLRSVGGYYKLPLAWGSDDITAVRAAQDKGIANTQAFCFQYRDNGLTISSSTQLSRLKIQATLSQHQWFGCFIEEMARRPLPPLDQQYLATIAAPRQEYYFKSLGKDCADGVKGNLLKLVWYYHQLRAFHFPKSAFVKWYLKSLYNLFK